MRDFLRSFFASVIGSLVAFILLYFIIAGSLAALVASESKVVTAGSVLELDLNYEIPLQTRYGFFENIQDLSQLQRPGMDDLKRVIKDAADNPNVRGVVLRMGLNPNSYSTLDEIRALLEQFRTNDKFIYAYGQYINQKSYYLGCAADTVFLHPTGLIDFKGFNAELSFYKRGLDKLGVDVQVFYDGKFKSATEPYRLEEMSNENRLQLRYFLDGIWTQVLDTISADRSIDKSVLQQSADSLWAYQPSYAIESGMVDGLLFEDELNQLVDGMEQDPKWVSAYQYLESLGEREKKKGMDKIAIIHAEGTIIDGSAGDGYIGGKDLSELLRDARLDPEIKAVVLRINSPGGSASASDVIWREVQLLAEEKTIISSMGSLAASGGYYMAAPADEIYAHPNTLTGSIGVFLTLPNMEELYEDKLGITSDTVKTAAMADFPNISRAVSPEQGRVLQARVDTSYIDFKRKVSEGRSMSMADVEEVAQGRIWTGVQALDRNLVDELGGLDEAVAKAAELARLGDSYHTIEWPQQEADPFEQILGGILMDADNPLETAALREELINELLQLEALEALQVLEEMPTIQARMLFDIDY
jgi:protease-4